MTTDAERLDWLSVSVVDDDVELGFDEQLGRHIVAWVDPRGEGQVASSTDGMRAAIDRAIMRERER
jgi:hypothetical protein